MREAMHGWEAMQGFRCCRPSDDSLASRTVTAHPKNIWRPRQDSNL